MTNEEIGKYFFHLYPLSCKQLSEDMLRAVDMFLIYRITKEDLLFLIDQWGHNAPYLLYSDDDHISLSPKLIRKVGFRRTQVIHWVLSSTN